jgi:hypothetical protein
MKKISLVFILIIIISYSIYNYQSTKVIRAIESQINESKKIDFSKIDYFLWNELLILSPYKNIKETEKRYKIDLSDADNSIEINDNINTIIFLNEKKIVKQINLSRQFGNFIFTKNPIVKDSAIFIMKKSKMVHNNIELIRWIQKVQ